MTRTRKQAKTDETHVHPSATLRAAAKVGEREFARWLAEGVLDRVPFRGRATRYTERNLLQATAARVMIDNGRTVRECAAITGAVSNDELARIVGEPAPSKPAPASSAQTSDPGRASIGRDPRGGDPLRARAPPGSIAVVARGRERVRPSRRQRNRSEVPHGRRAQRVNDAPASRSSSAASPGETRNAGPACANPASIVLVAGAGFEPTTFGL
jgi:hypothetical protein